MILHKNHSSMISLLQKEKYGLQTFTILVGNRRKEVIQAVFFLKKGRILSQGDR